MKDDNEKLVRRVQARIAREARKGGFQPICRLHPDTDIGEPCNCGKSQRPPDTDEDVEWRPRELQPLGNCNDLAPPTAANILAHCTLHQLWVIVKGLEWDRNSYASVDLALPPDEKTPLRKYRVEAITAFLRWVETVPGYVEYAKSIQP